MKTILMTELSPDFLIQGLGLTVDENNCFVGKVGRYEVQFLPSRKSLTSLEGEIQIISMGSAAGGNQYRPGDILMMGSDDLLDRAFQALDEMEQRGVVINLTSPDAPNSLYIAKDQSLFGEVQLWKSKKIPFLCLCLVEPVDSEGQAKLVTIVRKVMS